MRSTHLLALGALWSVVSAQQPVYGQCGGIGWTGSTTCAAGSSCVYSNSYYSQCLPGSGSGGTTAKPSTTAKTTAAPPATTKTTGTGSFSYLISFGDSYSQTGFTPSGAHASSSNPLGNPGFPGYTTSGGSNWIGYLLEKYNKGLLLSYNFAYGGATTDSALVTPFASTVLSFVDQVSEFSQYLANKPSYAPWTSSNALFAVWIGVNDVGNAWGSSSWNTLAPKIIARYISQLQILYNAGARNFLILTVPPIQRTPLVQAESSSTITNEGAAVVTYNNLLTAAVAKFKSSNSGVTTYVYDTTSPFTTALNNPTKYGAPNALCYNSDGTSCLWWNNYHPGQAIHNLVAQGVAALTGL